MDHSNPHMNLTVNLTLSQFLVIEPYGALQYSMMPPGKIPQFFTIQPYGASQLSATQPQTALPLFQTLAHIQPTVSSSIKP